MRRNKTSDAHEFYPFLLIVLKKMCNFVAHKGLTAMRYYDRNYNQNERYDRSQYGDDAYRQSDAQGQYRQQQVLPQSPYNQGYGQQWQQPYGQGYGQPPYQSYPMPQSNGVGTAGFVLALLGFLLFWIPVLDFILWLLGLILSLCGLGRRPNGLAIAGTIIAVVELLIVLCVFLIFGTALSMFMPAMLM